MLIINLRGRTLRTISESTIGSSCLSDVQTIRGIRTLVSQEPQKSDVRLRFAPSPTGFLHLGGLRTALLNKIFSESFKGSWILRVEDTDRSRYVDGSVESLLRTLDWANLDYHEGPDRPGNYGPYIQSHRTSIYNSYIDRLLESKQAYRCFCSQERLKEMRLAFKSSNINLTYDRRCLSLTEDEIRARISKGTSHVIRFKNPNLPISFKDLVYGEMSFRNDQQDDAILIKSDGMPTYHFANVIDDHTMKISHVLRGEEWLSSTPKHIALYRALGFKPPEFVHLPLLINQDGSKLSKRFGDVRVEDYIEKGYEPEALLNFVGLMGLNHAKTSRTKGFEKAEGGLKLSGEDVRSDFMSVEQMIKNFKISSICKQRSIVSLSKLDHLNQQHLNRLIVESQRSIKHTEEVEQDERREQEVLSQRRKRLICRTVELLKLRDATGRTTVDERYILDVLYLVKDRLNFFSDLSYFVYHFFYLPDLTTLESREMRRSIDLDHQSFDCLNVEDVSVKLNDVYQGLVNRESVLKSLNKREYMKLLRYCLTGKKVGVSVSETISVLGNSKTVERLKASNVK
ncbi:glutamyl-tRNA synthetase [Phakopsora pachyrhizi]|nr:glutamyl-tRNA synthetase [Phakopsora pachyrhizi]